MRKLKLAFVVPSFPETSETFIVNQITDQIDRGHDITIFSFKKNESSILHQSLIDYDLLSKTIYYEDSNKSLRSRYLPFIRFLFKNYSNLNYLFFLKNFNLLTHKKRALNLRFFYFYFWILRQNVNYDIFHAQFGEMGNFVAHMKEKGFFLKSGLVTTFHGYDLTPDLLNIFKIKYQPLFRQADLLTVNSPYSKKLLEKISVSKNILILPVGLDTEMFKRSNEKAVNCEIFTILYVGRLIGFKAPEKALQIVNRLILEGYEQLRLILIGEGEKRPDIEAMIKYLNLQGFVELKGALPQGKIIREMESADVFLLPGIYDEMGRAETQGLVIQEAQAMELPVVVSDAGGMKYGLIDGETGFVVKENDLENFADKIKFLIQNKEIKRKMGLNGRSLVVQKFDSRVLGSQLERYYYKIQRLKKAKRIENS